MLRLGTRRALPTEEVVHLYTEAAPRLWCVAVAIVGDRHAAEDVLQDAAVVVLQRSDQFQEGTNFAAWAGQIVRNISLRRLRDSRRHRAVEFSAEYAGPLDDHRVASVRELSFEPDDLGIDDDLARALGTLTETARVCLLMKTVLDLSYAEIAVSVGVPEGTAMSHVHRSRKVLYQQLRGRDRYDSSAEVVRS